MASAALTTLIAGILLCDIATAETITFDVIIANNVERDKNHYYAAVSEASRILGVCAGTSANLRDVRRLASKVGVAAITEELTRQQARAAAVTNGGNVLIVNDLRVCGDLSEPKDGNIVGCAGPGTALTIETFRNPRDEGRTIAHELGHSAGLMWRIPPGSPHAADQNSLMYRALVPTVNSPGISAEECNLLSSSPNMFRQPASASGSHGLILVAESDSVELTDEVPELQSDIDRILETTWYGEVLSPELDELIKAEDAISRVRAALVDGSRLVKRQNAATVLGEYGDPADIFLLQASFAMSHSGDDKAELQRFSSNVIGAIARLGVRHNSIDAVPVIQKIFAEALQRDASNFPVAGLTQSQTIDVMSSAATAVLQVSDQLQDAGLISAPEALVIENFEVISEGGNLPDTPMNILEGSGLNIDQNLLSRVFN